MIAGLFSSAFEKAKELFKERFDEEVKYITLRYNNEKKRAEIVLFVHDLRAEEDRREILRTRYGMHGFAVVLEQAPPESQKNT